MVRWVQEMPVWAPPKPSREVFPTEVAHTADTVTIRFRRNYFSDVNGKVIAYSVRELHIFKYFLSNHNIFFGNLIYLTIIFSYSFQIIVAEDYRKPTNDKQNLPKWQDVQQFRTWPPYQVSDAYYPFNNSSVEDFTVGTGKCESGAGSSGAGGRGQAGYCNGPLKPGTMYRFKIRAYTTREKHSETNWSQGIETDPDNTAFLVGIIIPIVLILIVIMLVLVTRR